MADLRLRPMQAAYSILLLGILVTIAATVYAYRSLRSREELKFYHLSRQIHLAVENRINTYLTIIRGVNGFFRGSDEISAQEFRDYFSALNLREKYPGMQAIGYSKRFTAAEKESVIAEMRKMYPDFRVWPEEPARDVYNAVVFAEPLDARNRAAIGYDMSTESSRSHAMRIAAETGTAAATSKVILIQEKTTPQKPGFLIYTPIYKTDMPLHTPAEKVAAVAGYVYSPFRFEDMLKGALLDQHEVELWIYDGAKIDPAALLYKSEGAEEDRKLTHNHFERTELLHTGGRRWLVSYRSHGTSPITTVVPIMALTGLLISFVLFELSRSQAVARLAAEKATDDLRQSQEALQASEQHARKFIESDVIGIIYSDLSGRIIEANDAFLKMTGYSRADLQAGKLNWQKLTPEEFVSQDTAATESLQKTGRHAPYEKEIIRSDGSHLPVLVGAAYIHGPKEYGIGFIVDLSERNKAIQEATHLSNRLEEQARALHAILSASVDHIYTFDNQGRYTYVSTGAAAAFGFTPEQMTGRTWRDLKLDPAVMMQFEEQRNRTIATGKPSIQTTTYNTPEGERHFEYIVAPVKDATGHSVIVVSRDITQRMKMELALRQSEEQLQIITDALPVLVSYVDRNEKYLFNNMEYESWFGVKRNFLKGRSVKESMGENNYNRARPYFEKALAGEIQTYEMELETKKGLKDVSATLVPHKTSEGVEGFIALITDITAQKRTQQAQTFLAEASNALASSLNYDTTLESIARLMLPLFADFCTIDVLMDDASLRLVAAAHVDPAKEELIREMRKYRPFHQEPEAGIPSVIRTGESEMVEQIEPEEWKSYARDEHHYEIIRRLNPRSMIIVPLKTRARIVGTMTVIYSDSGRRYTPQDRALIEELGRRSAIAIDNSRLYREAQELNRLKDEFLATVSHEIRTPLTAILGWARMISQENLDRSTQLRAVEAIHRNARSQAQIIDDLLDVSRIITGKLRLEMSPVSIGTILRQAAESIAPAAETKNISVVIDLEEEDETIHGDASRLQQMMWNILSNAIKFTPHGGRVEARMRRLDEMVEIVVSDTGKGIPPEFLPYVFDRFRQEDSSSTRSHGGLGLGLSIVRYIVELHGGTIRAESEGDGKGSTFTIELPVFSEYKVLEAGAFSGSSMEEKEPAMANLKRARVLVVEDQPDTREMLQVLLEQCDAEVRSAGSVHEALDVLSQWTPDILVSDIGLPQENGYVLIEKVRQLPADKGGAVAAIALTAYATKEDRLKALNAGYQTHIPKPVDPGEFIAVVSSFAKPFRRVQ